MLKMRNKIFFSKSNFRKQQNFLCLTNHKQWKEILYSEYHKISSETPYIYFNLFTKFIKINTK